MNNLMLLLFLICIICLIIGIIKPSIVIRWGEKRNRKKVFLYYGLGIVISFILFGVTIPKTANTGNNKVENTNNDTQEDKEQKENISEEKNDNSNEVISDDFSTFYESYKNMTDVQKDEYFKENKGKYVQWTGEITEVKSRYIDIKCDEKTFTFDVQCYINDSEKSKLSTLNKGDYITIKGKLQTRGGAIAPWNIDECEIIEVNPNNVDIQSSDQNTESKTKNKKYEIIGEITDTRNSVTIYINGTLKNNSGKEATYVQISFNLYDKDGNQIGTAFDNINHLEKDGTWKFKAFGSDPDKVASYKLMEVTGF